MNDHDAMLEAASKRTGELDRLQADLDARLQAIGADTYLSPEGKRARGGEARSEYGPRILEAREGVLSKIDADYEKAYKRVHGRDDAPSGDPQADTARELRLARVEREVFDELANGADPILLYKEARRLGETDRAAAIAKNGVQFVGGSTRKLVFRQTVARDEPEAKRRARAELESLDWQRNHLRTVFAMRDVSRRDPTQAGPISVGWNTNVGGDASRDPRPAA